MLRCIVVCSVVISLTWATTQAGPPGREEALDVSQVVQMAAGGKPPEAPPPPEFPKFEDVTKDMESQKGLFTLWYYPESAKDKDKEKLLCQIPAGFLGEKFMLSTSFSGGGFFTGFPLDERVVQWAMLDKQLLLIEPETRFVVDEAHTVSDVVRRTYPERIRAAVPILTKSQTGDPLIDFGAMLKSDFADISWMSGAMLPGIMRGGAINPSLSKWIKKKTFPLNVEMAVELAVSRMSPPGSYDKKIVHYSFWKLPKSDYAPRVADDRVGYFLTANQDWAKPTESRDIFNRYIDRWYLVKRDPSLTKCEPKQPIIFYIEKTVPIQFRKAVRDGIMEWNKAFEKIGFVNAVEVRQQTDDNEWKDLDPEDMRYSFFRWIVTGGGFAMGPHRSNPFTGQIYDADIVFDDSMVRYFQQSAEQMLPSAAMDMKLRDPALRKFVEQHPEWKRPQRTWERFSFGEGEEPAIREAMRQRMHARGHIGCDYAEGMKQQLAFANAVLAGQPKEVIERFLYDVIKEVVTHEVGHTLGLRHNFKASSIYTLEEIKKRRQTGEALVGSIMDYNPVLFFAANSLEGHFITPTIGPYDYWAIEYGYRPVDGSFKPEKAPADEKKPDKAADAGQAGSEKAAGDLLDNIPKELLDKLPPEARKLIESGAAGAMISKEDAPPKPGEKPSEPPFKGPNAAELQMLDTIAARAAEPELAYATDEDATLLSPDPRSNLFDMGSDPVDWARTRFELINKRMDDILQWAVKDRESWYHLRQAFVNLMFERTVVLDYVGRYIGGQYTSRGHRGDAKAPAPFTVVEPELQRNALKFIEENLFRDEFFAVSPEVLNHLAAPRWWHEGAWIDFTVDFPIHELIGVLQWWNLFDRLFPNTLRRIHDAEMKGCSFGLYESLSTHKESCWRELEGAGKLEVSKNRRSLQNQWTDLMLAHIRSEPGDLVPADVYSQVLGVILGLKTQIESWVELRCEVGIDPVTKAPKMGLDGKPISKCIKRPMDPVAEAHLQCTLRAINRALKKLEHGEDFTFAGG
jgi:hypothetical protein